MFKKVFKTYPFHIVFLQIKLKYSEILTRRSIEFHELIFLFALLIILRQIDNRVIIQ